MEPRDSNGLHFQLAEGTSLWDLLAKQTQGTNSGNADPGYGEEGSFSWSGGAGYWGEWRACAGSAVAVPGRGETLPLSLLYKQEWGLRQLGINIEQDTTGEAAFRVTKLTAYHHFSLLLKISANNTVSWYNFLKSLPCNFWHNSDPGTFLRQEDFVQ